MTTESTHDVDWAATDPFDWPHTPSHAVFRALHEADRFLWTKAGIGHTENAYDAALEEIDRLAELLEQARTGAEAGVGSGSEVGDVSGFSVDEGGGVDFYTGRRVGDVVVDVDGQPLLFLTNGRGGGYSAWHLRAMADVLDHASGVAPGQRRS